MIDPADVPDVGDGELLARFVVYRSHIRQDRTLKPDAFIPHPYTDLSVTRHLMATEDELWRVGHDVANLQSKTLHGRGDIQCSNCKREELVVSPEPIDGNPNHANISGWPNGKAEQKMIATEISAASAFKPVSPPATD